MISAPGGNAANGSSPPCHASTPGGRLEPPALPSAMRPSPEGRITAARATGNSPAKQSDARPNMRPSIRTAENRRRSRVPFPGGAFVIAAGLRTRKRIRHRDPDAAAARFARLQQALVLRHTLADARLRPHRESTLRRARLHEPQRARREQCGHRDRGGKGRREDRADHDRGSADREQRVTVYQTRRSGPVTLASDGAATGIAAGTAAIAARLRRDLAGRRHRGEGPATATDGGAKQSLVRGRRGTDDDRAAAARHMRQQRGKLLLVQRRHQAAVDDQRVDARIRGGGPGQLLGLDGHRVESGERPGDRARRHPREQRRLRQGKARLEARALPAVASHRRRDRLGGAQWNVTDRILSGVEREPRPHAGAVRGEYHLHGPAALGSHANLDLGVPARSAPSVPGRDHFDFERVRRLRGVGQSESEDDCREATEQPRLAGTKECQRDRRRQVCRQQRRQPWIVDLQPSQARVRVEPLSAKDVVAGRRREMRERARPEHERRQSRPGACEEIGQRPKPQRSGGREPERCGHGPIGPVTSRRVARSESTQRVLDQGRGLVRGREHRDHDESGERERSRCD